MFYWLSTIKNIRGNQSLQNKKLNLLRCVVLCSGLSPSGLLAQDSESTQLENITILGTQDSGEVSVGRNSLSAAEQARSIQIFDQQFMSKLKPKNIQAVVTQSSNVVFTGNNDGRENTFAIRGFDNAPVLRDGFRINSFGGITDPEIFNLERVEVLKGPDSIVYGEANPGGIINLVTKRPEYSDHTIFSLEAGTNASFSPRFDVNRSHGTFLSYRVVGLYDHDEGFRNYTKDMERYSLTPSLRWKPKQGTVLTFLGEYVREDGPADFGTAMNRNGDLTASIHQVNNHPTDTFDRHFYMTGLDFEHRVSDSLTAELRLRHFDTEYQFSMLWLPNSYDPDTRIYRRVAASQGQQTEEWATQLNLFGEFDLGNMSNRFVVGLDYRDTSSSGGGRYNPGIVSLIDWGNPDYSEQPLTGTEENLPRYGFEEESERYGVFVQNHIDITDRLLVSLGIRYDNVDTVAVPYGQTDVTKNKTDKTVYQAAVRYRFNDAVSVFANYSESFNPAVNRDRNGKLLEPEVGEGFEFGIKGKLIGSLGYTAAFFDITKNNVSIADPDPDFSFAYIAAAEQTSKGFEVDIYGGLTDALEINASLGFIDSEDENGHDLPRSTDLTSSAFITVRPTNKLDVSFGYTYTDERLVISDENNDGVFNDQVSLDPQFILNAAFGYEVGAWRAQLNIANLTDERYVANAFGSLGRSVHPGPPIEALFTLTYSFPR